nr:HNH endonuclease signature motif containing protein [uncultured Tyzzerella sp.]
MYYRSIFLSDLSGKELVKPQKSKEGISLSPNEWQIDHIKPKKKCGTNSYSNAQVLSRYENGKKCNK